jgi:TPR repeat protein
VLSQHRHGGRLENGVGISMDKSLGVHDLKLCADQGNADAQSGYRCMLFAGDGIDMNTSHAAHYLKLPAEQGICEAQLEYADCIFRGDAERVDFQECEKCMRLAVCQHSTAAQTRLGLSFIFRGICPV